MNYIVEFKNFAPQKQIQNMIQALVGKLEKKAQTFSPDATYLRLMLEENSVRKLYRVSITLELPKKTLATNEERHELVAAIRDAFAEIDRQFEAHKATLRGEPVWKRRARREQLRKVK